MTSLSVIKCHGTGNDFIILDARGRAGLPYAELARNLCRRRLSIGADGLLVIEEARDRSAAAAMRTFNADGSEAEMCGNGIRCVARYLHERDTSATRLIIETKAGRMQTGIVDWQGVTGVQVVMGVPIISDASDFQRSIVTGDASATVYAVSIGNPHRVVFTARDPFECDLESIAATAIASDCDAAGANVELVTARGAGLVMRVYERGVGETWACGTGACAAAAAAIASGRLATPVPVKSTGGLVGVAWDGPGCPAVLTGNAELVFHTDIDVAFADNVEVPENVRARLSVASSPNPNPS